MDGKKPLFVVALALGAVVLAAASAFGQHRILGRPRPEVCPPPPCYPPVTVPTDPTKKPEIVPKVDPSTRPTPETAATAPPLSFEGGPAVRGESFAFATPNMQGDQLGIPAIAFGPRGSPRFPPPPGQVSGAAVVPSLRSFKCSENDSPFPRDRVYFMFNYYDEVNEAVNRRFGSDLENLRVHREHIGVEKTFLDGDMSLGFRLPFNGLRVDSRVPGLAAEEYDVGDLTVILKAALWGDREAGHVLAAGLAVTAPTGPDRFAGYSGLSAPIHTTVLQPFLGGVRTFGNFFIHGYSALDIPMNSSDVTMWYNDLGIGYFLYRDFAGERFITGITPSLEVHVNSPLNHRGILDAADPAGTPDVVALTSGVTFEVRRHATFSVGFVTPVTGPRPFDWEVLAQLNIRLGGGVGWSGGMLGQ